MLGQVHKVLWGGPSWEGRARIGPLPAALGSLLSSPAHSLSALQGGAAVDPEHSAGLGASLPFPTRFECLPCPSWSKFSIGYSTLRAGKAACSAALDMASWLFVPILPFQLYLRLSASVAPMPTWPALSTPEIQFSLFLHSPKYTRLMTHA